MEEGISQQLLISDISLSQPLYSSQSSAYLRLGRDDLLSAIIAEQAVIIFEQTKLISQQAARITELEIRVKSLEDQLNKNSRNSSNPPSTDKFNRPKSSRKPSGNHVGGQKGHSGHTLEMAHNADQIIIHSVSGCKFCGRSLSDMQAINYERRQVFDIPPLNIKVTEHRAESKICPDCFRLNKAAFPDEAQYPVQYGSRLKSVAIYLNQYQLLPFDRLSEFFVDIFHHQLSQGSLVNMNKTCYNALEQVEEKIKHGIIGSYVGHFDETGMYIEGKREWCHVASTESLTYYAVSSNRGSKANEEMGILPLFKGTAMHDSWSSYFQFNCSHALCNAHHLRELTFIHEADSKTWAKEMIDLLIEIKKAVDSRKSINSKLDPVEIKVFEENYDHIIGRAVLENPPPTTTFNSQGKTNKRGRKKQTKAQNLSDRLQRYRREALAFMYDFRIPFDNNQAERDLRMMKVQQKISGCFRSWDGAKIFCRIRGYISTVKKNSISVIDAIQSALEGRPLIPPVLAAWSI